MEESEPIPFLTLADPVQLKAFTDPLRRRVLHVVTLRAATNQQVADDLGEPQAKVLHHLRVLLDLGLIRLVETRVRGGNVEKYYRAVARVFSIRPGTEMLPETVAADLEVLRRDVMEGMTLWPEWQPYLISIPGRITPERGQEFQERLKALVLEYVVPSEDPVADPVTFFGLLYRDPAVKERDASSQ
jgi:DNA-binding transcriptional ArsR family regulator